MGEERGSADTRCAADARLGQMLVVGADRLGARHRRSGCSSTGSRRRARRRPRRSTRSGTSCSSARSRSSSLVTRRRALRGAAVPHAPGRGEPRRPADPRQHPARGHLDRAARRSCSSRCARYAYVVLVRHRGGAGRRQAGARGRRSYGEQFTWTFEYNEGGKKFKTTQLYLPEGESVKFDVHSKDVIHDFWVPAWRMKIDAVPGITTSYRVTPDRARRLPGRLRRALRPRPRLHAPDRARAAARRLRRLGARSRPRPGRRRAARRGGGERRPAAAADGKALFTRGQRRRRDRLRRLPHARRRRHERGRSGPTSTTSLAGQGRGVHPRVDRRARRRDRRGLRRGHHARRTTASCSTPAELDALVKYLAEVTSK